jgi:hypothetical protein
MSDEFRQIIPTPPLVADEVFATHQVSQEFYREVEYRQELERYCQWYYSTAALHRQDLQKMRREMNIFGWFLWGRR